MMNYNYGKHEMKNWIIEESKFNIKFLGKCESIMAQGNGYLGLRNALEEVYFGETRNMFISGTFNKADRLEVTELPNIADLSKIGLWINNVRFSLLQGVIHKYP